MKQGVKTFRISAGKTLLGIAVFLVLLFGNFLLIGPWLSARLPEWLAWLSGGFIYFSLVAAGYLLSRTRRLSPAGSLFAAVIAGVIFGAIMAHHYITILGVVAVTAFPAWAGSELAVFSTQTDSLEDGE